MAVLRPVVFHLRAKEKIRALPRDVRLELGSALLALQRGFSLGLPVSRPMSVVMPGVEELRLRDDTSRRSCMSTNKTATARNAKQLADVLGLTDADRAAIEIQLELAEQIGLEVRKAGMTHAQLARLAGASRSRVTSILNGNLDGVSTDLLLRILAALGVRVRLRFQRAA
jgi:predicted XRE-type DNA-binding protein